MKTEINALVSFFQQHVEQQSTRPASFDADALAARLQARYAGHWHPQDPEQGSGYRSFTVRCLEPHHRGLAEAFAPEALFWVDPGCVAARLSAHAPLTTIYGSLPKKLQRDAAEGSPVKEDGQLPSYLSPVKRTNRWVPHLAIHIVFLFAATVFSDSFFDLVVCLLTERYRSFIPLSGQGHLCPLRHPRRALPPTWTSLRRTSKSRRIRQPPNLLLPIQQQLLTLFSAKAMRQQLLFAVTGTLRHLLPALCLRPPQHLLPVPAAVCL